MKVGDVHGQEVHQARQINTSASFTLAFEIVRMLAFVR